MKKFFMCALFAWWFLTITGYKDSKVETVGPFDSEAVCDHLRNWVKGQDAESWNIYLMSVSNYCYEGHMIERETKK